MIDLQPQRMLSWIKECFGLNPGYIDVEERAIRFYEESTELVQADDVTREQAHAIVDQVYDKAVGDSFQELGGVMVTLAAYCAAANRDPNAAFDTEMARVEDPAMMKKIKAKHDTKAVVSSKLRPDTPVFEITGHSDLNPNYRIYFGFYPFSAPIQETEGCKVLVEGVAKTISHFEWWDIAREPRKGEPIAVAFAD